MSNIIEHLKKLIENDSFDNIDIDTIEITQDEYYEIIKQLNNNTRNEEYENVIKVLNFDDPCINKCRLQLNEFIIKIFELYNNEKKNQNQICKYLGEICKIIDTTIINVPLYEKYLGLIKLCLKKHNYTPRIICNTLQIKKFKLPLNKQKIYPFMQTLLLLVYFGNKSTINPFENVKQHLLNSINIDTILEYVKFCMLGLPNLTDDGVFNIESTINFITQIKNKNMRDTAKIHYYMMSGNIVQFEKELQKCPLIKYYDKYLTSLYKLQGKHEMAYNIYKTIDIYNDPSTAAIQSMFWYSIKFNDEEMYNKVLDVCTEELLVEFYINNNISVYVGVNDMNGNKYSTVQQNLYFLIMLIHTKRYSYVKKIFSLNKDFYEKNFIELLLLAYDKTMEKKSLNYLENLYNFIIEELDSNFFFTINQYLYITNESTYTIAFILWCINNNYIEKSQELIQKCPEVFDLILKLFKQTDLQKYESIKKEKQNKQENKILETCNTGEYICYEFNYNLKKYYNNDDYEKHIKISISKSEIIKTLQNSLKKSCVLNNTILFDWKTYIDKLNKKDKKTLNLIVSRNPNISWKKYCILIISLFNLQSGNSESLEDNVNCGCIFMNNKYIFSLPNIYGNVIKSYLDNPHSHDRENFIIFSKSDHFACTIHFLKNVNIID